MRPIAALPLTILLLVSTARAEPRRPGELFLGLGFGNAVCDNQQASSQCPVNGALTLGLGGGWRFHPHWSVGLELAIWAFRVRDSWQGQLDGDPTDVKMSSFYLAPYARWYWFDHGSADPYLQAGVGLGSVQADAENADATYHFKANGVVFPLGIGVEWQLGKRFRLGPQALAYLHVASEICEDPAPAGHDDCRKPGKNDQGDREGLALPWRLMAMGTFTLGGP
jgi:hypothetical protein